MYVFHSLPEQKPKLSALKNKPSPDGVGLNDIFPTASTDLLSAVEAEIAASKAAAEALFAFSLTVDKEPDSEEETAVAAAEPLSTASADAEATDSFVAALPPTMLMSPEMVRDPPSHFK